MHQFTVIGLLCSFGPHQKMQLSAAQIDARRHALEVVDPIDGLVISSLPLQFKTGESFGLPQHFDALPGIHRAVLKALENVPAETLAAPKPKGKKPKGKKAGEASDLQSAHEVQDDGDAADVDGEPDFDALEAALSKAEADHASAFANHVDGEELTDEMKAAAETLEAARTAFNAVLGED